MKIQNHATIIFEFKPEDYFLVRAERHGGMAWSLNYRIERLEKGKDDDVGTEAIFVSDEEAEEIKKAGFSWMELV